MEGTTGPNIIDWAIIGAVFVVIIAIGLRAARLAGRNMQEFFLSGRHLPWWMLGVSMVATTFATDTPNLVTDIVRNNGVAGNWVWWAFLLTGMLTVFVYARLWRRSGVTTDLEFYELRYSGWGGRFLRIFRAVYLGLAFNVLAMSAVTLAAIKIGEVMLGLDPWVTVGLASVATLVFSTLGGFRGVIQTDFFLFVIAIAGSIAATAYIVNLPEVGGLSALLAHPEVSSKLAIVPDLRAAFSEGGDQLQLVTAIFIIPLAVQWWNAWYPGAEPGGGGYIAQRMLAAKNEKGNFSRMEHCYYGNSFSKNSILRSLKEAKIKFKKYKNIEKIVAKKLAQGKIIGWFQGKSEVGARALGNRSILANPLKKDMKYKLNKEVKHRENWRPFCPSIIDYRYKEYFGDVPESDFMNLAFKIKKQFKNIFPSAIHVDGSARPQIVKKKVNKRFYNLISQFEKITGHGILINTSFNIQGEPIVNKPSEAIRCFFGTGIDYLVIDDYLIVK